MVGTILLVVIVGMVAAIVGAFLALKVQRSYLNFSSIENQQNALERNQQNSRREWETRQERRLKELETNVTVWVEELQQALQDSEAQHQEQMRELSQQFETLQKHTHIEQVLDNLPRVEDTPLEKDGHIFPDWHPPILHDVDLSGRDLSYRYLRQADLRNAQLVKTNFFMADLSGAFLSGANLSGADLIGANLSGADLRNTILTGANVQVADLNNTLLTDANLLHVRNLTTQQLYAAVYDSTTLVNDDVNITLSHVPCVKAPKAAQDLQSADPTSSEEPAIPDIPTENMPAVTISTEAGFATEPEVHSTLNGATSIDPPETPVPIDEPEADEPSLPIDQLDQPEADEPSLSIDEPDLDEPPFLAALRASNPDGEPESSFPSLLPDLDSLIQQQEHSVLLSQLTSGDSLLDPEVADLLVDKPETSHTEGFDRANPKRKRNGKRRAKAS